jgi:hypothetical protein
MWPCVLDLTILLGSVVGLCFGAYQHGRRMEAERWHAAFAALPYAEQRRVIEHYRAVDAFLSGPARNQAERVGDAR